MIIYRIADGSRLAIVETPGTSAWVDVVAPTKDELSRLESEYGVLPDHITDILDIDEQSRIEKEDEYTLIICRLPVYDARLEVSYFTVPCGVLLFPGRIITVCQYDNEVLDEIRNGKVRGLDPANRNTFVLHLFSRAAICYLRYLKDINRRTAIIEGELQRSVKNHELTQLLSAEKSLVYFTTSIKSNEILLEKLAARRMMRFSEEEEELLEDVLTDNKQAITMSGIYSDILSGMMDAFASVISNNLNIVMKRLTVISIVLMIPTLVVSLFGMNIPLPLAHHPWAFAYILGTCVVLSALGALVLGEGGKKKPRRSAAGIAGPATGSIVFGHPLRRHQGR